MRFGQSSFQWYNINRGNRLPHKANPKTGQLTLDEMTQVDLVLDLDSNDDHHYGSLNRLQMANMSNATLVA